MLYTVYTSWMDKSRKDSKKKRKIKNKIMDNTIDHGYFGWYIEELRYIISYSVIIKLIDSTPWAPNTRDDGTLSHKPITISVPVFFYTFLLSLEPNSLHGASLPPFFPFIHFGKFLLSPVFFCACVGRHLFVYSLQCHLCSCVCFSICDTRDNTVQMNRYILVRSHRMGRGGDGSQYTRQPIG